MKHVAMIAGFVGVLSWCLAAAGQNLDVPADGASSTRPDEPARNATTQPADKQSEWTQILAFVDINSPNLAASLHATPLTANDPLRERLAGFWRGYNQAKRESPRDADMRLKTFKLWDQVFGVALQIRKYPDMEVSLQPQLSDYLTQITDLAIAERQLRITLLEAALSAEQDMLKKEQAQRVQVIKDRIQAILNGIHGQTPLPIPYAPRLPATTSLMLPRAPQPQANPITDVARQLIDPDITESQLLGVAVNLAVAYDDVGNSAE